MALVALGVTTVTSMAPAVPAGEVAVSEVGEVTESEVAGTEPKSTALAPVNPVPVMVTEVPPARGPDRGLSKLTTGAAS